MKILLIDIETSPNSAYCFGTYDQNIGINQLIETSYTMCWAAKWLGKKEVMFDSIMENTHKNMIKQIHKLLDECDAVIHYNGSKFDIPTLNKEFLLHGMNPPSPYKEIDLLRTSRSKFRFPSNKLDYVAQALGVGQKTHHEGFELWVKCMAKDKSAWKIMKKYNKNDVVILEKVYEKMLGWIKPHPNHNEYTLERVCPSCGKHNLHKRGTVCNTKYVFQRYQCQNCGRWSRSNKAQQVKNSGSNISI